MEEMAARLGRFSTTARLFTLVDELPRDQQLILLKQLLGDRITTHLFKLVLEMPEEQQVRLMEQMLDFPFSDAVVTTLTLDDDDALIRQMQRTSCRLRAVCVLDANTFDGVITDISTFGMFIKTDRSFPAGKPIRISCRLPGRERPLIINGEILRSEPSGIGIRLKSLPADQEKAILAFINSTRIETT
ncbi:MAG: PilZ domain-containing protein [Desulfobacterales bacterium]|jgi:hypothetical protein|nr:PilZ domain-containing protein [Desulfobacterales bacterium]